MRAFGGFGHELFSTLVSIRALTEAVTRHADSPDHAQHVTSWIASIPTILDRVESMMRMGMEYRGYGWPAGDPFVTKPMQVLDEIRKCYPETANPCSGRHCAVARSDLSQSSFIYDL